MGAGSVIRVTASPLHDGWNHDDDRDDRDGRPMKQKRAQELRDAWGDAPCEHPQLAKLYDLGVATGSFACVQCGRVFSFREKAELAASRRP
jgi:hypothetical protein